MAFTFNWAGVNVPTVNVRDTWEDTNRTADNLGRAVAGYKRYSDKKAADAEYAEILDGYNGPSTDRGATYLALQQELASLKARNNEIARKLGI